MSRRLLYLAPILLVIASLVATVGSTLLPGTAAAFSSTSQFANGTYTFVNHANITGDFGSAGTLTFTDSDTGDNHYTYSPPKTDNICDPGTVKGQNGVKGNVKFGLVFSSRPGTNSGATLNATLKLGVTAGVSCSPYLANVTVSNPSGVAGTSFKWNGNNIETLGSNPKVYDPATNSPNLTVFLHSSSIDYCGVDAVIVTSPSDTSQAQLYVADDDGTGKVTAGSKEPFSQYIKSSSDCDFNSPQTIAIGGTAPSSTTTPPGGSTGSAGTCDDGSKPNSQGVCQDGSDPTLDCGGGSLDWIICPLIQGLQFAAERVDAFITDTLNTDVTGIFDNTGAAGSAQNGYYEAWNSFRILATGMLVIGGLVMVASEALGFEALDAYTIRKVLPRLLIAIIGISLSWPILRYTILFFDTLGFDIRDLMYTPFSQLHGHINVTLDIGEYFAAGAAIFVLGWSSLTLIATGLLALFVGFLILVIRQLAIIVIIILAPIAIAGYILPNTQRLWKLWRDNFLGLMLMFPIISAFIAAGHIFAAVSLSNNNDGATADLGQIVGMIAYFAPYFVLPLTFRMATGAIGNIAGFVNDRHRGAFDRLKNARSTSAKERHAMRMAGQTGFSKTWAGRNVYRRGALIGTPNSGALGVTKAGREKFKKGEQSIYQESARKALEHDAGSMSGHDMATKAAHKASGKQEFLDIYGQDWKKEEEKKRRAENEEDRAAHRTERWANGGAVSADEQLTAANAALGQMESSFGSKVGSGAMRVAAFNARAASVTGYTAGKEGLRESYDDAAELVRDGLMSSTNAVSALKANKGRVEQAGASFGDAKKLVDKLASAPVGTKASDTDADMIMDGVMEGFGPGTAAGMRKESAEIVAEAGSRRLDKSLKGLDNARAAERAAVTPDEKQRAAAQKQAALEEATKSLADVANIRDAMNSMPPQVRERLSPLLANGVDIPELGGWKTTREHIETLAGPPARPATTTRSVVEPVMDPATGKQATDPTTGNPMTTTKTEVVEIPPTAAQQAQMDAQNALRDVYLTKRREWQTSPDVRGGPGTPPPVTPPPGGGGTP